MCSSTKRVKSCLYLGLDPCHFVSDKSIVHYPVIKILPRLITCPELQRMYENIKEYSHIIFTSKSAVNVFFTYYKKLNLPMTLIKQKCIVAVGRYTKQALKEFDIQCIVAKQEQQEGIITLLQKMPLNDANILLPRSSLARPVLTHFLVEHGVRHHVCNIYDTIDAKPDKVVNFSEIDEIVFTSPSTVGAFFSIYESVPEHIKLTTIGPVTKKALDEYNFDRQKLSV